MYMTKEEEKMYRGESGPLYEWAMRFLAAYGDGLKAERLVKVNSVLVDQMEKADHLRPQLSSDLYDEFLKTKMAVPTYTSTLFFTKEDYQNAKGIERQYQDMGVFLTGSCAAYTAGWIPTFGSNVASVESAMYVYTNSVFGARTHRESYPGIFAIALTGKTPFAGLHTDEGRRGNLLVRVEAKLRECSDYWALGFHIGTIVKEDYNRPVLTGVPNDIGSDELKSLGAGMQSQGSVGLFHAVGVTPEARSIQSAFGGDKPVEKVTVNDREIKESHARLSRGKEGQDIDYVILGCPHYSIRQVAKVAELLRGKRIHKDVRLGILVSPAVSLMAAQMGIKNFIEKAGAEIVGGGCFGGWIGLKEAEKESATPNVKVATDSGKCAWFRANGGDQPCFGCAEECVSAAISGRWGDQS